MLSVFEPIREFVTSDRPKHLAGFAGFAVFAGLITGVEVGLLERDTLIGLIAGTWLVPLSAVTTYATTTEWKRTTEPGPQLPTKPSEH